MFFTGCLEINDYLLLILNFNCIAIENDHKLF